AGAPSEEARAVAARCLDLHVPVSDLVAAARVVGTLSVGAALVLVEAKEVPVGVPRFRNPRIIERRRPRTGQVLDHAAPDGDPEIALRRGKGRRASSHDVRSIPPL